MKKGNLEIKEDMDDSFVFRANNYSVYRIGNMQDLKDLRSLIDTVLKEERKIGGHTYSKSGKDMCCQPLTEGEKCECKEMSCKDGCDRKHTCKTFWCEKCKPQESNKEGEPSKKPSERISELSTIMVDDVKHMRDDELEIYEMKVDIDATIQYLDELHNQGKI